MANLEKVIRITEDDYSTLLGGGTITKDGVTYTYDESALYVIQNEDPPAYAETAGVANTAVADSAGNNIAATYDKKPLVIEVDDTDTSVPSGTYDNITAALAAGRDVVVKMTWTDNDNETIYLSISENDIINTECHFYASDGYWRAIIYGNDTLEINVLSPNEHLHGNITSDGQLQKYDITIANGDKLVVTDADVANRIARASLTFDGSTTTQALSKKGTWETFAKPTMVVTITRSGTHPNFIYTANKTYAEIGAALEAGTNVVLVQNNYYYWFYAKGRGSTPDLVFKRVTDADMQPVSDGSINYIQSYKITINSSNTLTFSSDIIDLTGKVDKVTSTDNAIARFNGTGGQIQNSGVTINDSNHVTAAKFITSGGTNSQVVLGDGTLKDPKTFLQSMTITPQLSVGSIGAMYSNQLNNAFYALDKRKTVTGTGFASFVPSYLFNNIGDVGSAKINAGETAVITIGSENDTPFTTYTYGWIYVTFYTESTKGTAQSVSIRAYGTKGGTVGWHDYNAAINPRHLDGYTVNNCFRCYNDTIYSIKAWEITIVAHETLPTYVSEVFAIFTRSNGEVDQSVVTKYANAQDLYGAITIHNNLTANKFITSGGTSSQFVKGDGSLDSTTYTPQTSAGANSLLSSLPDWTAVPTDTTKLVRRDTGGSASFGQVTFLTVWNYINGKAATVYAPLASPALTGTPTAPTATAGTNTTQIATTAFVLNAVNTAIAGVTQFDYKVVTSLPSTGVKGRIYLISNGGTGQNIYDEYIWYEDTDISGRWEKIGTTEVDLSGYAKLSPTSILTFTGDHMLKGTLTVNNPSSGGSLPLPSEIAIGGNGKITLAGEGDFSKVISGSTTLQDALNGKQEAPLVIEVNDTDTNVPYDTYNNITAAVTAGKDVWLKVTLTQSLNYKLYMRLSRDQNTPDHMYWFSATYSTTSYTASIDYTSDFFFSKAILALRDSPTFTGTPTAPTAASGTNTTQVATTAFVQNALSNMGAGGSEMVDVTITGTTSSASFSTNPYNAIKAVVDDGKIAVLNASVAPLSATGVLIPVYEYTYSQSGSDFTGYKGKIQNGNYEISVDVQSTSSATVTITSVGSSITVDTALSESSTNPVQNRVITAQILENEEIVATALNNLNDRVELKQDQLVSGTTIKTINNQSILGSGNITISGGGGGGGGEENVIEVVKVNGTALTPDANKAVNIPLDSTPTANSGNAVTSGGIKSALDGKATIATFNVTSTTSGGVTTYDWGTTKFSDITNAINNCDDVIIDYSDAKFHHALTLSDGGTIHAFGQSGGLFSPMVSYLLLGEGDNDSIETTLTSRGVVNADWNEISSSSDAYIKNKPNLSTVAITGSYEDLIDKPTIPTALSDLTDDSTHRVVTDTEKSTWNGKYTKPSGGIPKTDLASAVQTSLGKADTSLQPDVANDLAQGSITSSTGQGFDFIVDSTDNVLQDVLDDKQVTLVSGTNIKTIDGNSLLGSGDLTVFPETTQRDLDTLKDLGIYRVGTSYICICTSAGPPSSPFYVQTLIGEGNIKTRSGNSLPLTSSWTITTYSKPSTGIPATDLASAVQTSLGKADTALQPDVDNDLAQGTISSSNSQGFNYIIADKDTSSEQTLQDALDAKASTSAVNAKYTKPAAGIPDTDLTTAVNVRLLAQLSSSSDDGKIMKYSYSGGGWQAVKPVTIYSGSSAPSSSTGSNGDIYIQTS